MKKAIIIAICAVMVLPACKKYEDGPAFTLRSKKARLTGGWTLEQLTENGTDITEDFLSAAGSEYEMHLEADGAYHVHGTFEDEGTWKFEDDKEKIVLQSLAAGAQAEEFTILKLKNKELWLQHAHDDETLIFHYKQ